MNPKLTAMLLMVCLLMLGLIFFVERPLRRAATVRPAPQLLPGFKASAVTSLQIRPAGQFDIRVERTNGGWRLTQPLNYPADGARLDRLLQVLGELNWIAHVSAQELKERPNAQEEFGFSTPQISLIAQEGGYRRHLLVGKQTAVGDQVYVQIVGGDGFFLTDAEFLKYVPRQANDLRDTGLIDLAGAVPDTLKVRSGTKGFDLQRHLTNRLWTLTWPLSARADNTKVEELLARLRGSRIVEFASDAPDADMEHYGLQAPELELGFLRGTNDILSLQIGKSPTNNPALLFVRRNQENSIFLVPREPFDPWRAVYTDFRERRLLSIPANELDNIHIRGDEAFTLSRETNSQWEVAGRTNFPADPGIMRDFLLTLTRIQTELEKTVVTDFAVYGLSSPLLQYTITNQQSGLRIAQIDFGTNAAGVFAHRSDESFVNVIKLEDFRRLPRASWQFRDRRVWDFESTNVISVTVQQKGERRTLIRNKDFEWSFAPGSQGIINAFSLDETLHRLGEFHAVFWVARGEQSGDPYGFQEADHQISLQIRRNRADENLTIAFGRLAESQNPYAKAVIDGQPTIFEFPWPLYYDPVRRDLMITKDPRRSVSR